MRTIIKRFWTDELGSSMIDWAVFGAGAAALSTAIVSVIL